MKIYIHTIIALLALTMGYPYGGTTFITILIPYLIFMVLKRDAIYLPALMIHAASETSASTVIFLGFILLSIWNYKLLFNFKLKILFWALISLLPIFIWLVWQRIFRLNEYPPQTFAYIGFYLSFFAFFYGVLISKSFNKQVIYAIYITLFVVYLTYLLKAIEFTRIIVAFSSLFIASLAISFTNRKKNYLLLAISFFAFASFYTGLNESPMTPIFVSLFAFIISLLYFRSKTKSILRITGYIPFILIFILYAYGIINYMGVQSDYSSQDIGKGGLENLSSRVSWKFFSDRAPFWAGGFNQIVSYMSFFPIHNIPNIVATMPSGRESEITFGSHTTFIELIRKYGLIAGSILSYSLIHIVIISRKVFKLKNIDPYVIPLFAMATSTTIVLSLAGQYQILPGYALLSLGILGIAYPLYYHSGNSIK